jgi:hypothetical protein
MTHAHNYFCFSASNVPLEILFENKPEYRVKQVHPAFAGTLQLPPQDISLQVAALFQMANADKVVGEMTLLLHSRGGNDTNIWAASSPPPPSHSPPKRLSGQILPLRTTAGIALSGMLSRDLRRSVPSIFPRVSAGLQVRNRQNPPSCCFVALHVLSLVALLSILSYFVPNFPFIIVSNSSAGALCYWTASGLQSQHLRSHVFRRSSRDHFPAILIQPFIRRFGHLIAAADAVAAARAGVAAGECSYVLIRTERSVWELGLGVCGYKMHRTHHSSEILLRCSSDFVCSF